MKWFLNVLFLCTIKNVYCKSIEVSEQNDSRDVNKFLGKVLHADKFNELADRIAERAVKKLRDYQKPQFTAKLFTKSSAYRPKMKTLLKDAVNYSYEKSRGLAKHKHGKIDVDAVLKKTILPISDLKLRYVHLKNKHSRPAKHMKKTEKNNDEEQGDEKVPPNYKKLAQNIQLDFDENIKTLSDENFKNPFGHGEIVSWDKIQDEERKIRSKIDSRQLGDNVSSEKENAYTGTTRTEGDKQFAHVESPDYKEYHEHLANVGSFK